MALLDRTKEWVSFKGISRGESILTASYEGVSLLTGKEGKWSRRLLGSGWTRTSSPTSLTKNGSPSNAVWRRTAAAGFAR